MTDPVFDIFREEAREHFGALEKGFLDLEAASVAARRPLIDNLFRHAHSLKGDAKAIGVAPIQREAQKLEDILDRLRSAPESIDQELINRGLAQLDLVRKAYDHWNQSLEEGAEQQADSPSEAAPPSPIQSPSPLVASSSRTEPPQPEPPAASGPAAPTAGVSPATKPTSPTSDAAPATSERRHDAFTVRVPSQQLDRMLNLAGEVRVSQRNSDRIRDRLTVLQESLNQLPLAGAHRRPVLDRDFDQLRAALAAWRSQALDQLRYVEVELRNKAGREELLVESLEADIRQARLLPLVVLTDSLRRPIRDLAQSLGKSIRYDVEVGKIMLDKAVIEGLREPLLHLVRNAADHGLETPAERVALGKPEEGRIRIEASRRGEFVVIRVSDDGRGVDIEKIRERLRLKGALDEAELLQLTERDLARRLFEPGFSTAEAGDVSGRGVGLDVVQTEVQRLHGAVELDAAAGASPRAGSGSPGGPAAPGPGATFVITAPVTISTVRILTVLAGGQYYGIPTSAIIRTGSAAEGSLHRLQAGLVLSVGDQLARWAPLCDLLGTVASGPAQGGAMRPYLLIGHEGQQVAVVVDDLEDESEVLLKPLGFPLGGQAGVMGGAVRPDGSVQVVLDVAGLAFDTLEHRPERSAGQPRVSGRIMVVDDSPTTRTMLRNFFTAAGYMVRTACDGVDALERLRSQLVDLVISDVEMPRMNGLDLTRHVKSKLGLPVILVTGKEKEEHRREGLEAGADAYVVKSSFEGEGLLEIVKQFV